MAWSTRRLAHLAGTTVKTIRHYHAIDLLEEPMRSVNGYKQYRTPHLVRLLQIGRMRSLGMSLAQIAATGESDDSYREVLQSLDAELAESIERQQAMRTELAHLMRHRTGPDVPSGFETVAESLTDADRAMMTIAARFWDDAGVRDLRDIAAHHRLADDAFNALSADADADTIRYVAARLAAVFPVIYQQHPGLHDRVHDSGPDEATAMAAALLELYNPAQIEALRQAYRIDQQKTPDAGQNTTR